MLKPSLQSILRPLALAALLCSGSTAFAELAVQDRLFDDSRRVARTEFEYDYRITVTNTGTARTGIVATVSSSSPDTVVVDATVTVGDALAGATVTPADTFTIRHNRRVPFDPATLSYEFTFDEPDGIAPTIAITSPADGASFKVPSVDVSGTATDDTGVTSVTVNGVAATLSGDTFSATIPLVLGSNNVTAVASDAQGNTASASVTVIHQPNRPPTIDPIADRTAEVDQPFRLFVAAADPDGDTLTFSVDPLPAGAAITSTSPTSARFDWTPANAQTGAVGLTFWVTDGEASVMTTTTITVREPNRPPAITSTPVTAAEEGVPYRYAVEATDPDSDALAYELVSGPAGMTINSQTGVIAWTPGANQDGTRDVIVQVKDGRGGFDEQRYSIRVTTNIDRMAPAVSINAPTAALVNSPVRIAVSANDNVGVSQVDIQVDAVTVSTFTSPPYELTYNAPANAGETLDIRAIARDDAGNTGEAIATVLAVEEADITPPVIEAVLLPPEAAAGQPVIARAIVRDDRGVASVAFSQAGNPLGTPTVEPYEVQFVVPIGASVGSLVTVDVLAIDTEGNTASAQASLTVVADTDIEAPDPVTVSAPATARAGQEIAITGTAVDNVGVLKISFLVDGVVVGDDVSAPYEAQFTIPSGQTVGTQFDIVARAVDFAGNAADSAPAVTEVVPADSGYLTLEVYDDSISQPIAGATVAVSDPSGQLLAPLMQTTDEHGRYRVDVPSGRVLLAIQKDGFTGAWREIDVMAGELNEVFDARLTPLAEGKQVNPLAGSALSVEEIGVEINVPPAAFTEPLLVSLTPLSGQSLPAPLPLGWSPQLALAIGPTDLPLNAPLTLVVGRPLAEGAIPVAFNPDDQSWTRLELDVSGAAPSVAIPKTGTFAFAVPDQQPEPPATPNVGEPLAGVTPVALPENVSAEILPSPRVIFLQPDAKSDVSAVFNPDNPLPSGSRIEVNFTESYDRRDSATLSPEPTRQDFLLYQTDDGLRAEFAATPSEVFDPFLLIEGVIQLNALRPDGNDGSAIIGPAGGTVVFPDGINLQINAGAFDVPGPVKVTQLGDPGLSLGAESRFTFLAGAEVDLGGRNLATSATLAFNLSTPPAPGAQILAIKPVRLGVLTPFVLVGIGTVDGNTVTISDGGTGLPLAGVDGAGRYYLVRMDQPAAFVTGAATTSGPPLTSVLADNPTLPIRGVADLPGGQYVLPTLLGETEVRARDLVDGRRASGKVITSTPGQIAVVNLDLQPQAPTVLSVTPADGAIGVELTSPVIVEFSQPMDASTINGSSFVLREAGNAVAGSVSLQPDRITAVFRPSDELIDSGRYEVFVANTVLSEFGDPIVGNSPDGSFLSTFTALDRTPPERPAPGDITASIPDDGSTSIIGSSGTVEPGTIITATNTSTGGAVTVIANAEGGFIIEIDAGLTDQIELVFRDDAGNEAVIEGLVFRDPDGATIVGELGGVVSDPSGVELIVPVGAVPNGTRINLTLILEEEIGKELHPFFRFVKAVHVDMGGVVASKELKLSTPVTQAEVPDSEASFFLFTLLEIGGDKGWSVSNSVEFRDGRLETTSPPFEGVVKTDTYVYVDAGLLAYEVFKLAASPVLGGGTLIGVSVATPVGPISLLTSGAIRVVIVPRDFPFSVDIFDGLGNIVSSLPQPAPTNSGIGLLPVPAPEDASTPLDIDSSFPSNGNSAVQIDTAIGVTFNKAVMSTTTDPTLRPPVPVTGTVEEKLRLFDITTAGKVIPVPLRCIEPRPSDIGSCQRVVEVVTAPGSSSVRGARIYPERRLRFGHRYRVSVEGIRDFAGQQLSADKNIEFVVFQPRVPERRADLPVGVGPVVNVVSPGPITVLGPDQIAVANTLLPGQFSNLDTGEPQNLENGDSIIVRNGVTILDVSDPTAMKAADTLSLTRTTRGVEGIRKLSLDMSTPEQCISEVFERQGLSREDAKSVCGNVFAAGGVGCTIDGPALLTASGNANEFGIVQLLQVRPGASQPARVGSRLLSHPLSALIDGNFVDRVPEVSGIPRRTARVSEDIVLVATSGIGIQAIRLTDACLRRRVRPPTWQSEPADVAAAGGRIVYGDTSKIQFLNIKNSILPGELSLEAELTLNVGGKELEFVPGFAFDENEDGLICLDNAAQKCDAIERFDLLFSIGAGLINVIQVGGTDGTLDAKLRRCEKSEFETYTDIGNCVIHHTAIDVSSRETINSRPFLRSLAVDAENRIIWVSSNGQLVAVDLSKPFEGSPAGLLVNEDSDFFDDRVLGSVGGGQGLAEASYIAMSDDRNWIFAGNSSSEFSGQTVSAVSLEPPRLAIVDDPLNPNAADVLIPLLDYYPDLGAKTVRVRATNADGSLGQGRVEIQSEPAGLFHSKGTNNALSSGIATFTLNGSNLSAADLSEVTATVRWFAEAGSRSQLVEELKVAFRVRDNSNVTLAEVLAGTAIFVRPSIDASSNPQKKRGVTARDQEKVFVNRGLKADLSPQPRDKIPTSSQMFDFVEEMLNQVVGRKLSAFDNGFGYILEDGRFDATEESAVRLLREQFGLVFERETLSKIFDDYGIEDELEQIFLQDKIIDRELLVGEEQRVVLDLRQPCNECDVAFGPGQDTGLYELYMNVVRRFIHHLSNEAKAFVTGTTGDEWVSRVGEKEPVGGAVSYCFGCKDSVAEFNSNRSRFGATGQIHESYRGDLIDTSVGPDTSGGGELRWPGLKQKDEWELFYNGGDISNGDQRYRPFYWAGVDCGGFVQHVISSAASRLRQEISGLEQNAFYTTTSCDVNGFTTEGVGLCAIERRTSIKNWSFARLASSFLSQADNAVRRIPRYVSTHRGDLRVSGGHVAIIWSEELGNDYYIISALGPPDEAKKVERVREGIDGSGNLKAGFREVVVTSWRNHMTGFLGESRVLLWE